MEAILLTFEAFNSYKITHTNSVPMSYKTLHIHHKNQLDNALWETMTVYCENLHCGIKLETLNVQTTGTHSNH